jgi:pimeloyl-ACP methyl ester carboxylesterase
MKQDYTLIQVATNDRLVLNGLYQPGDKDKTACVYIHGFVGDFYTHAFFHSIADALKQQGNAFILAQHRGTGLQTEFVKTDHDFAHIGSYYELLEDAHYDITAFIKFLQDEGYGKVVLIGHSLGTIKAVRYLFEGELKDQISALVLVSPFDKNVLMQIKAPDKWPDFVAKAKEMVDTGRGKEIVPVPEWEDFPLSYQTFYSWYHPSELGNLWDFYNPTYDFPALHKISVPVKAILGDKDEFVTYPQFNESAQSALNIIKQHIKDAQTTLIPGATHDYNGFEQQLAAEVQKFITAQH